MTFTRLFASLAAAAAALLLASCGGGGSSGDIHPGTDTALVAGEPNAFLLFPNPQVQPVTVALNNLAGSYIVEWNIQMAGSLIASLPTLLVYIFLSRYFIRGLMAGSLKG